MPGIGNPNQPQNNFAKISKYNGPARGEAVNPNSRRNSNIGEVLNDIAGAKQEQKFVDKDQHNRLDKNAFLKLLSTQLANQDPLKPMDQKKFAADMAQLAQLEQMTNMNTKMDKTVCVDRRLITGSSPLASNKLGKLAVKTLLKELN